MSKGVPEAVSDVTEVVDATGKLLLGVVRRLVSRPDQVTVENVTENRIHLIVVAVAREDLEKVVGRHGRTARSLRAVVSAIASKTKKRMELEVHAREQDVCDVG